MELSLMEQALGLTAYTALGLALGFVYDLLRPPRYGTRAAWLWDLIFCALSAFTFFLLNMSDGRAGIWEIAFLLLGFCLYIHLLSPLLLPVLIRIHSLVLQFILCIKDNIKKIFLFIKKVFSKE